MSACRVSPRRISPQAQTIEIAPVGSPTTTRTSSYSPRSRYSPRRSRCPVAEEEVDIIIERPNRSLTQVALTPKGGIVNDIVPRHNIENQLEKLGYAPIEHIITQGVDGEVTDYIKAIDRWGNVIFIALDAEGETHPIQGSSIFQRTTSPAVSVPASVMSGLTNSADKCGCGVALVCDNGICVMSRGSDGVVKEDSLSVLRSKTPVAVTPGGSTLAYPVIPFSSILANPAGAAENLAKANKALSEQQGLQCGGNFAAMSASFKNMETRFKELEAVYLGAVRNLDASTNTWTKARTDFGPVDLTALDPKAAGYINVANQEIIARDKLRSNLNGICQHMSQFASEMTALGDKYNMIVTAMVQDYNKERLNTLISQ